MNRRPCRGVCARCQDLSLTAAQVLLLSSRNALLSRRVLLGGWPCGSSPGLDAAVSLETCSRFAQLAFGRFAAPAAITPVSVAAVCSSCCLDQGRPTCSHHDSPPEPCPAPSPQPFLVRGSYFSHERHAQVTRSTIYSCMPLLSMHTQRLWQLWLALS